MSKKSIIEREKKRKSLVKKYKNLRNFIKKEIKNELNFFEKIFLNFKLQKFPRDSSPCRLHNRCYLTGRPRGYYRFFGLSRHIFRDMAHYGLLPGVTKSSW
uniref:Small ribosomal subunit protein uS14c n=1 Tax=Euglena longa TaxID=3037 RepID=RR14_EUGLO|nr:ribosomal protein S14 [Euglena longa]P24354.1 RecName: Full=Small ribosomal subunit protein uS14c; AltName: Full=Plastid 30S ribosomal protein S14 [Euglena longa]CAC24579.1 ribosomal protein S14 [Euglena longa]